jgi:hypothetical protein
MDLQPDAVFNICDCYGSSYFGRREAMDCCIKHLKFVEQSVVENFYNSSRDVRFLLATAAAVSPLSICPAASAATWQAGLILFQEA